MDIDIFVILFFIIMLAFNCYQLYNFFKNYKKVNFKNFVVPFVIFNFFLLILHYNINSLINYGTRFYFTAFQIYFFLGLIYGLLKFVFKFKVLLNKKVRILLLVLTLVVTIVQMNFVNNIFVKEYEIKVDKSLSEINLVMVSDVYIGYLNNLKKVEGIVGKINSLNADIVVINGNLFYKMVSEKEMQNIADILKNIKSQYGVYATLGNLEDNENAQNIIDFYENLEITVLDDLTVEFGNISIIGRKNNQENRNDINELLGSIDAENITILLGEETTEATESKIDLLLAKSNKLNRIFPMNVFLQEKNYKKINETNIINNHVSGSMKMPFSLGSFGEIVQIKITN